MVILRVLIFVIIGSMILSGCSTVHAWDQAHATYYEDSSRGGACGYGDVQDGFYGDKTAALSGVLFNNGEACGGCYELQCINDDACYKQNTITVTITNMCPQGSNGGWCDNSNAHFDLSKPAFAQIAQISAGHVNIQYQKVICSKSGGVMFAISGHTYWMSVLLLNVAGTGDVTAVLVKGSNSDWVPMTRSWGTNWQTRAVLDGQALSFAVTTGDGRTINSYNVAGSYWQYGQTFEGLQF